MRILSNQEGGGGGGRRANKGAERRELFLLVFSGYFKSVFLGDILVSFEVV